jgi:hypothetical protein
LSLGRDYPGLRSETWGTRFCGRTDNFGGGTGEAAVEGFDGVGAGEEEPVEAVEVGEGGVEGGEGGGVGELDGGDEDGIEAEGAELVG